MALVKCVLGNMIELISRTNVDLLYGIEDVRGVNNLKKIMPTKADLEDRDISKFQIVNHGEFFFNHRTSRNGSKFSITYNYEDKPVICTEDYVVFRIKPDCEEMLIKEWLYMFFNRSEFDRYVITNSWGSSTEFFNWDDICSVELELPDYETQKKYVDVYNSMIINQACYEKGLDDLKLTCDAYIEKLRREIECEKIASYIKECNEKNENNKIKLFQGINVEHVFTDPKRIAEDTENGSIVRNGQFAFNKVMKANNVKF